VLEDDRQVELAATEPAQRLVAGHEVVDDAQPGVLVGEGRGELGRTGRPSR
jgi:hypothetical protein